MNRTATINPWALLGIGAMVCLTVLGLVVIVTGSVPRVQIVQTAQADTTLAAEPAGIYDESQNDPIPQGQGCGMGGGCGCGG